MAQDDEVLSSVGDSVFKLQLDVLKGIANENHFFAAASLISKSDYEDVVAERSYSNLCGYPLCSNALPLLSERPWKGKYHISSSQHIVYDLEKIYKCCSLRCNFNSEVFAASLQDERWGGSVLDSSKLNEILKLFGKGGGGGEDKGKKNLVVLEGLSKFQIQENMDPKKTVSPPPRFDLIGPSNAIEGYVPLRDRDRDRDRIPKVLPLKKKNHKEEEGSKSQSSRSPKKASGELDDVMDALRQAPPNSVASGELDVMDAVSKAGISILPQPEFIDGGNSRKDEFGTNIFPQPQYNEGEDSQKDEDELEPERLPLKWPMKTGTLDLELFDSENSWYDTPPEGFSLSLSPFATMWMSLFRWITSSSLAYIYGSEESSEEEFLLVNGREYPRKIVLDGGRSSEIMNTLSGCLTRSLPELVSDLRISIPISVLDKGMGRLLDTMTFMDALPPFRMKQWHMIILIFLDALSVCRIPGLTPYMTSSRMLQHKVLDGAQLSVEEYRVMKDLLIPLGRAPLH